MFTCGMGIGYGDRVGTWISLNYLLNFSVILKLYKNKVY